MEKNRDNLIKIARHEFIKLVEGEIDYKKTHLRKGDIKPIFDIIDVVVQKILDTVNENQDVEIQFPKGFVLGSKYIPPRNMCNPKTREEVSVDPTVKVYAQATTRYKQTARRNFAIKSKKKARIRNDEQ